MEQEIDEHKYLEKLITECKNGNVVHQELLYKHFYSYSLSICRLYTYSNDDAVSVLNDSFLKVFSSIQKNGYNNSIPFRNWLRKILINTSIDNYRKNSKHYYQLDIAEIEDKIPDEGIVDNLTIEDILKLLDQLPKMHRLVFNLYEIQGFNHQEIALKLAIGESTSRVFLTRAKKKLRVLLNNNF